MNINTKLSRALALISLTALTAIGAIVAQQSIALTAGQSVALTCPNYISRTFTNGSRNANLVCTTPTRTSTAPRTRTPTNAPSTFTPTAAPATVTPSVTAHAHTPTATSTSAGGGTLAPSATPSASGLTPVDAAILGTCSAATHDAHAVTGPDGRLYRTWHPQAVGGCRFAHEHGDDPATSNANGVLPPFGYIAAVSAHPEEPHQGFKIAVANLGEVNDEGRVMLGDARVVFHMGTGGPARYSTQHHSAIVDIVMPNGPYIHVQGLFDTAGVGSICERDRNNNDNNFGNDIGRTVMTLQNTGCNVDSAYEIWVGTLDIQRAGGAQALRAFVTMAVFDPITTMDAADKTKLIYTTDAFANRLNEAPFMGAFRGCDRENYHTAPYWYNSGGQAVYFTDAFGAPGGVLRQELSTINRLGIDMAARSDGNLGQFKERTDYCGAGLGVKN